MVNNIEINYSKLFDNFFDELPSRNIEYLILHHISDISFLDSISTLKKCQVSSHYIINDDGEIFCLVEDKNIAYHAGISYWNGQESLNKNSIGIEFFSKDPFSLGFSDKQIESGIKLCQKLIAQYHISPKNIIGHSDIAYHKENGFLDRKQDPSHLFPWEKLAQNNLGIWPKNQINLQEDHVLFSLNDNDKKISKIKYSLSKIGYKIVNFDDNFDEEFLRIVTVFNRHFNRKNYDNFKDKWLVSSDLILKEISTV